MPGDRDRGTPSRQLGTRFSIGARAWRLERSSAWSESSSARHDTSPAPRARGSNQKTRRVESRRAWITGEDLAAIVKIGLTPSTSGKWLGGWVEECEKLFTPPWRGQRV